MSTETSTTEPVPEGQLNLGPLSPPALILRAVVVFILVVASLFVWRFARSAVVAPFDSLVTEQACRSHGAELQRPLTDFERSNRFGLRNRTFGYCQLGSPETAEGEAEREGEDGTVATEGDAQVGEGSVQISLELIEFGPLYRLAKAAGILTQLAIVSIFLRLVVDPAMDLYRMILRLLAPSKS